MTGDDDFPEFAAHSMRNPIEPDPQSAPFKAEVVARLRAVKALDKAWSGKTMAVPCPHCDGGLLPEDFVTIRSATSRDLELARRRRKERK